MAETKIKIDGKEMVVKTVPLVIEILSGMPPANPQEVIRLSCNQKKYSVNLNSNKKLQMTAA
jgi:hypothetical protein